MGMKATPRDILTWTGTRIILEAYARMATNLEPYEFNKLRQTLIEEITAIEPGKPLPEIWGQAVEAIVADAEAAGGRGGLVAYAL